MRTQIVLTQRAIGVGLLLQGLAVLGNVEAFQLLLERNPQRHEDADHLEQHKRHAPGPKQGNRHAIELEQQLTGVALDQSGTPPIAAVANTPASRVPVIPPIPCTPNTSSESS